MQGSQLESIQSGRQPNCPTGANPAFDTQSKITLRLPLLLNEKFGTRAYRANISTEGSRVVSKSGNNHYRGIEAGVVFGPRCVIQKQVFGICRPGNPFPGGFYLSGFRIECGRSQ